MRVTRSRWIPSLRLLACLLAAILEGAAAPPAVSADPPQEVIVGAVLPLSGPLAEFGTAMRNGIELARSHGLLPGVRLIFEDSRYDPSVSVTAFRKLVESDHASFIISLGCPPSRAIAPLAERMKVPTAAFCSSMGLTKNMRYVFSMTQPANEWSGILERHLVSRGRTELCAVLTENDYLISEFEALRASIDTANARANSSPVTLRVLDRVAPATVDFNSVLPKLAAAGCEALGVYLLPGQVRSFFARMRAANIAVPTFGTDIFESPEEIAASGPGIEGAVFVNVDVPSPFRDEYRSVYGNDAQVAAACVAHDVVARIATAGKDIAHDPEAVYRAFRAGGRRTGRCGESDFVTVADEHFFRFPIVLKQVQSGAVRSLR